MGLVTPAGHKQVLVIICYLWSQKCMCFLCSIYSLHGTAGTGDSVHTAHIPSDNRRPAGDEAVHCVRVVRAHSDATGTPFHVAARHQLHRRRMLELHYLMPSRTVLVCYLLETAGTLFEVSSVKFLFPIENALFV